jgi:hypothetical protein
MGEEDARVAAGRVLAALREAGRSEGTIRRYQVVLDRFTAFLAGRGLSAAGEQACVDFIADQTGTRLGALREPVADADVQVVRRPTVLMAEALAGREVVIDRPVIPVKDGCPGRVATPRRPWSRRTRQPAGSWPIWTRRVRMTWRPSACGTCQASCCASAGCGAGPSQA